MNKSLKRGLAILLLVLTLVVAGLVAAAWSMLPLDGTVITVEGERFALADLTGTQAAIFFAVAVAVVVALVIAGVVAGALGLGFGALGIAFGALVSVGAIALVAAPFVLVAWLLWRLVRSRPASMPMARP